MLDPVVLFFVLGVVAGLLRAELRLPAAAYEMLSVLLLLAIGLKGGIELATRPLHTLLPQIVGVAALGVGLTLLAYAVLRLAGRFGRADAASIAAHYGSVSVGTYAVAVAYLGAHTVAFEEYMPLFVVVLEVPAIVVGILLVRGLHRGTRWGELAHEVLLGKSIVLLLGGLLIGWASGPAAIAPVGTLFFGLFKGVLALFLLEMGLIAASQFGSLRQHGLFLLAFGVLMPLAGAACGAALGLWLGLSVGGTAVLATLAASSSYIAVPAAMRIALPEANPTLSLAASLGITFPFNITIGIPLYLAMAQWLHRPGG